MTVTVLANHRGLASTFAGRKRPPKACLKTGNEIGASHWTPDQFRPADWFEIFVGEPPIAKHYRTDAMVAIYSVTVTVFSFRVRVKVPSAFSTRVEKSAGVERNS